MPAMILYLDHWAAFPQFRGYKANKPHTLIAVGTELGLQFHQDSNPPLDNAISSLESRGLGSLVVKVTESWSVCHDFERGQGSSPGGTEGPKCSGRCSLNVSKIKCSRKCQLR
ncbi:hypothetical protein TNCV_2268241 [Trichonephila clavipes]|nr:hypothetical protein TNCV_2268241 [Trichonephila clavipes]